MGSCNRRHYLLSICLLQLLTIIERQVFDFLGYMWAPIIVNFFHIIFVIFGFYGAYHLRAKYIITYIIWSFIWIGWNAFVICFYLNIGILNNESSELLDFGTGSYSWFLANGPGCKPSLPTNLTNEDPSSLYRPNVENCILDYQLVEIIHSGVQCILAVLAIIGSILLCYIFLEEDDQLKTVSKKSKHRQSLYSIEFGPSIDSLRSCRSDTILDYDDNMLDDRQLSPKPMTPRRVKRRSVMTRGTNSRQSTTSRRSHTNTNRNSTRSSRRKYHNQNPVTKLMEQQQQQLQQQSQKKFASFHHNENPSLTASNLLSFNSDILPPPPQPPPLLAKRNSTYNNFSQNIAPDPIYYNMGTMNTQWPTPPSMAGHYNPTYQHSTPNLANAGSSNALDNENEHVDDLYNNRPPSVRSSYSNFHGTRPLSSYNTGYQPAENVFAELTQQIPPLPPVSSHHYRNLPPPVLESQNIPLSRRSASRESIRSMAFINQGPPAYNLNYHTPPDSETTM
ncbi:NKAIN4 family protein [Megaselia abdita]